MQVLVPLLFLICGASALAPLPCVPPNIDLTIVDGHKTCTVHPLGDGQDDTPTLNKVFKICGRDSTIVFPEDETFWIASKLHASLDNVLIEWRGKWLYSPDTAYWRANSYYITFQNHRAAFTLSGKNIRLNGYGTGAIDGNGDVWYDEDKGRSTEGRPMPFVLWNITDSTFDNFGIHQSQFWSLNIMNGTNLAFDNITCSAFSNHAAPGQNWVQNADGFNTMDANNITLHRFTYRGGDDCIAIKPRSYNIRITDLTCEGGNGIAIGSLGQYLVDSSVENVTISNAKMTRYSWDMRWSVYIKTWMGELIHQDDYESDYQPRGGGWGNVRNLLFENFVLEDVSRGPYITQNNGNDGTAGGTSMMEVSDVVFRNFTGKLKSPSGRLGEIGCSRVYPCSNIFFENMDLEAADGKCSLYKSGTIYGLPGC